MTGRRWLHASVALALLASIALVFGQTVGHEFVLWDDDGYILRTPQVLDGLSWGGVKWAFVSSHMSNWHPLTWLSMMADVSMFGLWAGGHHLVNVAWHGASAVMLYFALLRLAGDAPRAALVAFLFALHPLHVESVAWVSERKDLICAFFWNLALLAYAGYVRTPSWGRYLAVFGGMAAALLAKPMAMSLPAILLALDFWPLGRYPGVGLRRLIVEKLPLAALGLASAILTLAVQQSGGSTRSLEQIGLGQRLENVVAAYATYVVKTFLPTDLSFFHAIRPLGALELIGSATLIAALIAASWRYRKSAPQVAVGLIWFALMLVPVIGIVRVGDQAWASRYTYLPHIGLFIALVWTLPVPAAMPRLPRERRIAAAWVTVLLACGGLAALEARHWKSSETLFGRALEIDPANFVAYSQLAEHYVEKGRHDAAIDAADNAIRNAPPDSGVIAWASITQSRAFLETGRLSQAEQALDRAVAVLPNLPMIHLHRGTLELMRQNNEQAIPHLQRAIALKPDYSEAHNNLGVALARTGRLEEALAAHRAAFAADGENFTALYNVGATLERLGRPDQAARSFEELAQRAPRSVRARVRLARLAYARGDAAAGDRWKREVLALDPGNSEVRQLGGEVKLDR